MFIARGMGPAPAHRAKVNKSLFTCLFNTRDSPNVPR
jgi:hypothetical protein